MNGLKSIQEIEREIDEGFASSKLLDIGYAQSAWTLLSFNEDHYLKYLDEVGDEEMHVYCDIRLNALAYPLRVAFERAKRSAAPLENKLIDRDYQLSWEWLEAAEDYDQFNSIFPLWHRNRIEIEVSDDRLVIRNKHNSDRRYEAYNRLVRKEARTQPPPLSPPGKLLDLLMSRTTAGPDWFHVRFNRQLSAALVACVSPTLRAFAIYVTGQLAIRYVQPCGIPNNLHYDSGNDGRMASRKEGSSAERVGRSGLQDIGVGHAESRTIEATEVLHRHEIGNHRANPRHSNARIKWDKASGHRHSAARRSRKWILCARAIRLAEYQRGEKPMRVAKPDSE
jgi:hypothetical protein